MVMQPPSNLPTESQRWGRYVDDQLREINSALVKAQQDIANSFRGLNASITALSKQIDSINELQNSRVLPYGERNAAYDMPTLVNNQPIASIEFSKPTWATDAVITVMVSGYLVSNSAYTLPVLKLSVTGYGSKSVQMWQTTNASTWSLAGFSGLTFTWSDAVGLTLPDTITASVMFDELGDTTKYWTGVPNRQAEINATVIFTR